ncbi:MAG: hypothetical protein NC120_09290 [Ruminococcus sp.]|nr:hypothetical protein [Ruminococcus sp.]
MFKIEAMGVIPDTALKQTVFDYDYLFIPLEMENLNSKYQNIIKDNFDTDPNRDLIDDMEISLQINFDQQKGELERILFVSFYFKGDNITNLKTDVLFTNEEWETFKNRVIFSRINSLKLIAHGLEVDRC